VHTAYHSARRVGQGLARQLPEWSFTVPRGGLSLWVDLGRHIAVELSAAAADRGVRILPGSTFDAAARFDDHLRIPSSQPPDLLRDAVSRLTAARMALEGTIEATPTRLFRRIRAAYPVRGVCLVRS
jgi:DNA-binding transcriptional MocR family regulator